MDIAEFIPGPINDLRNILEEIFQYIPTMDLLWSCRLVCQNWYWMATAHCQDRHVRLLKPIGHLDSVSDICLFDIFRTDAELPWSSVDLEFDNHPANQKFSGQVCDGFGSSLRSISAFVWPTRYDNFFRALRRMTNLEELEFSSSYDPDLVAANFIFPADGDIQLRKLKHLEVEYNSNCQSIEFLEFILQKTGAGLDFLKITTVYANKVQETEFQRLAQIICTLDIENLVLDVSYDRHDHLGGWKILAEHPNLKIQELGIHSRLKDSEIEDPDQVKGTFDLLEQFLAKCIGLHTLRLFGFELRQRKEPIVTSKLLKFPKLPDLKILKLDLNSDNFKVQEDPQFPVVSFNLIKATDFPNLEMVDFHVGGSMPPHWIDIGKLFDTTEDKNFDNVKFLGVGNIEVKGKLASIFPNITKISVCVTDSEHFSGIVNDMTNVNEIVLTLRSFSNNNTLLMDVLRDILLMEHLKKLTVWNSMSYKSGSQTLNSTGLIGLALLHPVVLTIYNAKVKETDHIVTLLRSVHPDLQIFQE